MTLAPIGPAHVDETKHLGKLLLSPPFQNTTPSIFCDCSDTAHILLRHLTGIPHVGRSEGGSKAESHWSRRESSKDATWTARLQLRRTEWHICSRFGANSASKLPSGQWETLTGRSFRLKMVQVAAAGASVACYWPPQVVTLASRCSGQRCAAAVRVKRVPRRPWRPWRPWRPMFLLAERKDWPVAACSLKL
eukprot:scaffold1528_cov198-Pinguiococcus_pyrenoidosus.AAC.2